MRKHLSLFNNSEEAINTDHVLITPHVTYIKESNEVLNSTFLNTDTCNIIKRVDGEHFIGGGNLIIEYEADTPSWFDVPKHYDDLADLKLRFLSDNTKFIGEYYNSTTRKGAYMLNVSYEESIGTALMSALDMSDGGSLYAGAVTLGWINASDYIFPTIRKIIIPDTPWKTWLNINSLELTEVIFPESDFNASFNITSPSLTKIHIPKNTTFTKDLIKNCPNLKEMFIDQENPYHTKEGNVVYSKDYSSITCILPMDNIILSDNYTQPVPSINQLLPKDSTIDFFDTGDSVTRINGGCLSSTGVKRIRIGKKVKGYVRSYSSSICGAFTQHPLEIADFDAI